MSLFNGFNQETYFFFFFKINVEMNGETCRNDKQNLNFRMEVADMKLIFQDLLLLLHWARQKDKMEDGIKHVFLHKWMQQKDSLQCVILMKEIYVGFNFLNFIFFTLLPIGWNLFNSFFIKPLGKYTKIKLKIFLKCWKDFFL